MTEPKPTKRVYSKRRDYKAELEELGMFCRLSIDILVELVNGSSNDNLQLDGQIVALKAVLARIEKKP